MIVVDFRHVGTTAWLSEVLKISVRTSVSCAAQSFSTRPGMLSGPAAFRGIILYRVFLTSAADRHSAWSLGGMGSFCAGVSFCISNRELILDLYLGLTLVSTFGLCLDYCSCYWTTPLLKPSGYCLPIKDPRLP